MKIKKHSRNGFWFLPIFMASFLGACASTQESAPHQEPTRPDHEGAQGQTVSRSQQATNALIVGHIANIETAFSAQNCASVLENSDALAKEISRKTSLPPLAAVAVAYCESEKNPTDKDKLRNAIQTLDNTKKTLGKAYDGAWVEHLKSERYLAARERDKALKSRQREREILLSQQDAILPLDIQISEQGGGISQLPEDQRAKVRRILTDAQSDENLFRAVQDLDALLPQITSQGARTAVLEQRALIVSRIEQLFAVESAQLEDKKAAGDSAEAREQAKEMKKRFPARTYEARIDAMMNDGARPPASGMEPPATGVTPPPSASPAAPGATPTPQTDMAVADKALNDARAAMNSGDPATAVDILDGVPEKDKTDKVRHLRKEAAEQHVKELRLRVRELYSRASSQSNRSQKLETLKQCKQILELILSRYPDTSSRPGVERNLKTINNEIQDLGKGY